MLCHKVRKIGFGVFLDHRNPVCADRLLNPEKLQVQVLEFPEAVPGARPLGRVRGGPQADESGVCVRAGNR